ncbi:glycoside hydrolase family 32 protein [uncultured Ruminococcus sp.]|uniref:glycoside hydrolase family 32 protein n=1 Tax=uncultured Ruminococcus sp. TaxID=165186 RepID=UPI0025CD404E|nr:glycoside hydrolase family 32 protein [uncultured Ruminococcus sp.]
MNVRTQNLLCACQKLEGIQNKSDPWRPEFHVSPPVGWMNDPNGLCQIGDTHHLFFQYSPFDTKPGLNYWGHFSTRDFVHYTYQEPALCSDEQFDCHGVYSGSVLVENGQPLAFYTGNVKKVGAYDYVEEGREHNTILAQGWDGCHFHQKTLLLRNEDYPENVTCHVRDPKVWKEQDTYCMVLGARRKDDVGEVLFYQSTDLLHWELKNSLVTEKPLGYMWECPDYFVLDGVSVLTFSPQGVPADGFRFQNIYQSGYCVLHGDIGGDYTLSEFRELDAGFDFYAPQTYQDEQGRRILIGWLGMPDSDYGYAEKAYGWTQMQTIPRVLSVRDGALYQQPLPELQALRRSAFRIQVEESSEMRCAPAYETDIRVEEGDHLTLRFGTDGVLEWKDGMVTLSFGESGLGRTSRTAPLEQLKRIQLFCDTSSIEIFLNDGALVFTSRFYADPVASVFSVAVQKAEFIMWELQPISIRKENLL